jgi:hypothetical protein
MFHYLSPESHYHQIGMAEILCIRVSGVLNAKVGVGNDYARPASQSPADPSLMLPRTIRFCMIGSLMVERAMTSLGDLDCQTCGACCSYSRDWPRFSTESDAALDLLPPHFVAADNRGMRCDGERCSALSGRVGSGTACLVYDIRPDVCRACSPGDADCLMARAAFGMT